MLTGRRFGRTCGDVPPIEQDLPGVRLLESGDQAQAAWSCRSRTDPAARRTPPPEWRPKHCRPPSIAPNRLVTPSTSMTVAIPVHATPRLRRCESEDQDEADAEHDRRHRVDLRRHAEADHRIDLHRKGGRGRTGAGGEIGDDELVDREREGEERSRQHAGKNDRQGNAEEGAHLAGAEVDRCLDDRRIEILEPRAHDGTDESDVEDRVGDDDRMQPEREVERQ